MRRTLMLVALVALAFMVAAPMALAAVRTGTEAPETLTGTKYNDRITGWGGNDLTIGKGGNDAYVYADGWGEDFIKDSGGRDTLDFSRVTSDITANLCTVPTPGPGEGAPGLAQDEASNGVVFGAGIVPQITENASMENVRLGRGSDVATGCGLDNTYSAGGGYDRLTDYGGIVDYSTSPATSYPKSDDVYSGLGGVVQVGIILDGGGQDAVNLKPVTTGRVGLLKQDIDRNGTADTLVILTSPMSGIEIQDANNTLSLPGLTLDGRIEKVIFKNKTVSSAALLSQAVSEEGAGTMAAGDAPGALEDPAGFLEEARLP